MAQTIQEQVAEFHTAMDLPIGKFPKVPSDERVRLRARMLAEEFFEMMKATFVDYDLATPSGFSKRLYNLEKDLEVFIAAADVDVQMPEFVDGILDMNYINAGTLLEFGVNEVPLAAEVHRANMAKVGGPVREDGKRLKPPGWTPPDIAGKLEEQCEESALSLEIHLIRDGHEYDRRVAALKK